MKYRFKIIALVIYPIFNCFSQQAIGQSSISKPKPVLSEFTVSKEVSKSTFGVLEIPFKKISFKNEFVNFEVDTLFDKIYAIKRCKSPCDIYSNSKLHIFRTPDLKIDMILESSLAFKNEIKDSLVFVNFMHGKYSGPEISILRTKDFSKIFTQKAGFRFFYWEHFNKKYNIGIVRSGIPPRASHVRAIDLATGKDLWESNTGDNRRWDNIKYINDSIFITGGSELKCINIRKGVIWEKILDRDYDYESNKYERSPSIMSGLYMPWLNSFGCDALIDSSGIYTVTKTKLIKLDFDGKILWEKPINEDLSSKMFLIRKNNLLLVINTGYIFTRYNTHLAGESFIAAFNSSNGKLKYLKALEKKEIIANKYFVKDSLTILSSNKLFHFSISQEDMSLSDSLVLKHGYEFSVGNDFSFERTDTTHIVPVNNAIKIYMSKSKSDSLFFINNQFKIYKSTTSNKILHKVFEDEKYFYTTGNYKKLYVVDKQDFSIKNSLDFSTEYTFDKKYLYVTYPKSIVIYDRKSLSGEAN